VSAKVNSPVPCSEEPVVSITEVTPLSTKESAAIPEAQEDSGGSNCDHVRHLSGHGRHPHFISAHLGTPCTLGALDHHLDCGHKISTDQPEPCASNCKKLESKFPNPWSNDKVFVCMTCIVGEVKRAHDAKVLEFQGELKVIASAARKQISRDDIARQLEVIEIGWRELDLKVIRDRVKRGQMSRPFYVEPDYIEAVEVVTQERYYDETHQAESKLPIPEGGSFTEDEAGSSNAALTSTSRTPSQISSDPSSSSESVRSRLPVRHG
jgi:hypothetical protein